jgi:hypothetical protein
MKRVYVDFNTAMQDAEHGNHVILGMDDEVASGAIPALQPGEHVLAYDEEMEVEGVVEHRGAFWLAALDWTTIKRFESVS